MSTSDTPGYNPANNDQLALGCWAESSRNDGSYIFVEAVEGGRVIYSMFDTSKTPIVEFRDAMDEDSFKRNFSWKPTDPKSVRWTWHDKTPFPWDIVIKSGAVSGARPASARDLLDQASAVRDTIRNRIRDRIEEDDEEYDDDDDLDTDAARVARDLGLQAQQFTGRNLAQIQPRRLRRALLHIRDGIQAAINELR